MLGGVLFMIQKERVAFLRYPGGKQRQLPAFARYLPASSEIKGRYIEPFLGGGAIFFSISPKRAILSDINLELMDLYFAIRDDPQGVWEIYCDLPVTKEFYYSVRAWKTEALDLLARAARTLYLNRTCFKGMWRHNANGDFNVGYGGPDRKQVISRGVLENASEKLQNAELRCCDFRQAIELSKAGDFIFLDPPYRPGQRDLSHAHYQSGTFNFADQVGLSAVLNDASIKGVRWVMTNSSHPDILSLYEKNHTTEMLLGTGRKIGEVTSRSGESVIRNFVEG